jgi:PEP-CTERM motif
MNRPLKHMPALALCIVSIAATAHAQLITSTANLPPIGGVYLDASIHQTYGGPALQLLLALPQHKVIADEQKFKQGLDQNETFNSELDANLTVIQAGNTVFNGPITATGFTNTLVHNRYDAGGNEILTGTFQTEMLSMNLSGNSPVGPFLIRESPTLQSTGQTTIAPSGGQFVINSFFDVFTELSLDGGNTWMPSTTGPGHVTLQPAAVPEPTSMCLLAVSLFGAMGFKRRRG